MVENFPLLWASNIGFPKTDLETSVKLQNSGNTVIYSMWKHYMTSIQLVVNLENFTDQWFKCKMPILKHDLQNETFKKSPECTGWSIAQHRAKQSPSGQTRMVAYLCVLCPSGCPSFCLGNGVMLPKLEKCQILY